MKLLKVLIFFLILFAAMVVVGHVDNLIDKYTEVEVVCQ